jgi:hypothetical protein
MFYIVIFAVMAVLLVVAVFVLTARNKKPASDDPAPRHHIGTEGASQTHAGSGERKERKRRRAQSRHDRRKRH